MKGMYSKSIILIVSAIVTLASFSSCGKSKNDNTSSSVSSEKSSEHSYIDTDFSSEDLEVGYDETSAVSIKLNKTSVEISSNDVKADGSVVTISNEGVYVISGELSNGQIIVDAGKKENVHLIMSGANVTCEDNAPILINKANKVIITLDENSENTLTDGNNYNNSDDNANVDGTIFSRADLTINGSGKLTINSNYKHAIVCKDSLVITGGEYNIKAKSGGIYGKDCVRIKSGAFTIKAGSNGIRATNSDENEKGYIYIKEGKFEITCENDGIEAVDTVMIDDGEFQINTGGGSSNASVKSDGARNENWGKWRNRDFKAEMNPPDENREMSEREGKGPMGNPPSDDQEPTKNDNIALNGNLPDDIKEKPDMNRNDNTVSSFEVPSEQVANSESEESTETVSSSAKGLKSDKDIVINNGKITIDSSDDSVHSNGNVIINNGDIALSSGDDGIHSDNNLFIEDGIVNVNKSYEGLEGMNVTITSGQININANDDGINAAGGSDTGLANRMGRDKFGSDTSECYLKISGGKITINAEGDGLDSNGNLIIEGGEIYVSGPSNEGNGALDYGDGANAWITGGTIVACGSSGMAVGFGEENSTQNSVLHNFSSKISAGTQVKLINSNGETVLNFTPKKDFQSIVLSSPQLENGIYTISAGDISDEITINSIVTSNGNNSMGKRDFNKKS